MWDDTKMGVFVLGVGKVSSAKWGSIQGNLAGTEDPAGGAKKKQLSKVVNRLTLTT